MCTRFSKLLSLCMVFILAACSSGAAPTPTPEPQSATVQLSWFNSLEFAGLYEAQRQNYYQQSNLTVNLAEGGISAEGAYINPVEQVLNGDAQFGVAGADVILRARSAGAPVVAVMSLYQRSPVTLISLPETGVMRPQDLVGKRIGIAPPDTTVYISYRALLEAQGIDPDSITEIPVDPATSVQALMNGEIDVLHAFVTHEATMAKGLRDDVEIMVLSDYGIDIYNNVIFTTEDIVQNQPELVHNFVKGTAMGLQWAIDNPADAAEHVITTYGQAWPAELQELQKEGMLASVPLIRPAGSQPGMMKADVWQNTLDVLSSQQLLEGPVDVSKAYTLDFVNQAYATETSRSEFDR